MQAELAAQGYAPGAWDEIDAGVIEGSICELCAHVREYHAYRKPGPLGDYRAFAVCTGCGDVEEF